MHDVASEMEASMQDHLLDRGEVCRYFGGTRPINPSTLYRGIRQGTYPKQIKIGGSSRWLLTECRDALAAMVEDRS
jgi:predicted DNA-binding transcriptional regulator AlpA